MNNESPFISVEIVDRPLAAEREDMWDQLVDLAATEEDLEVLILMREEAGA